MIFYRLIRLGWAQAVSALLALLVQGLFDLLDRVLIPRGLRLAQS